MGPVAAVRTSEMFHAFSLFRIPAWKTGCFLFNYEFKSCFQTHATPLAQLCFNPGPKLQHNILKLLHVTLLTVCARRSHYIAISSITAVILTLSLELHNRSVETRDLTLTFLSVTSKADCFLSRNYYNPTVSDNASGVTILNILIKPQ